MFQDDAQAARALRALLATLGLQDLWSPKGPSQSAVALRRAPGRSLTTPQHVLLQAAWCLWDRAAQPAAAPSGEPSRPASRLPLDEVIGHLDRRTCEALFSLVLAYLSGPEAIEAWLATPPPPRNPEVVRPPAAEASPGLSAAAWTEELGKDWPTLDVLSLRYIRAVIDHLQGNQARAADMLGIDRRTLSRVLAKARSGHVPAMQTRR